MNNIMTLKTKKHGEITLTPDEQALVYEFYRLHCTIERIDDIIEEVKLNMSFLSHNAKETVAKRILSLKDDYHTSEDESILTVLQDEDYIKNYIK